MVALYGTAPTGSEKRIGAGHFELAPVLEMAFALRQQWTISTTAGTKVSLGGHQGHEHEEDGSGAVIPHDHPGSLYSPHAETELESRIALTSSLMGDLENWVSRGMGSWA